SVTVVTPGQPQPTPLTITMSTPGTGRTGGGGAAGGGGGGGGGGAPGGGAAAIPPHQNGLKGIPPTIFTGDRSKTDAFLSQYKRYRLLNHDNDAISIPFYRVLTALSYMRGPLIDDWVDSQVEWLEGRIDTT